MIHDVFQFYTHEWTFEFYRRMKLSFFTIHRTNILVHIPFTSLRMYFFDMIDTLIE